MYRELKDKDIQNLISDMAMYATADMKSAEKSYEIRWVWDRMTCIHQFQRRFDTTEEFNMGLDVEFLDSLHEACKRAWITEEKEKRMIESSGWNMEESGWNMKEDLLE